LVCGEVAQPRIQGTHGLHGRVPVPSIRHAARRSPRGFSSTVKRPWALSSRPINAIHASVLCPVTLDTAAPQTEKSARLWLGLSRTRRLGQAS
jgi:hypothetical protein